MISFHSSNYHIFIIGSALHQNKTVCFLMYISNFIPKFTVPKMPAYKRVHQNIVFFMELCICRPNQGIFDNG